MLNKVGKKKKEGRRKKRPSRTRPAPMGEIPASREIG